MDPRIDGVEALGALVGAWDTEMTHPYYGSTVVHGRSDFQWLEGKQFVILRARTDHPDFPDSISVIGDTAGLQMHYFDSRGVFRIYDLGIDETSLTLARDEPGFSQRFTGTFEDDGTRLTGLWKLSRDDATWDDDLQITYRRQGS